MTDRLKLFESGAPAFVRTVVKSESEDPDADVAQGYTDVIASTATPDRYGDVVLQEGWDLANFKANPVIMPFHNYASPPVGRAENIRVEDSVLKMRVVWDTGWDLGKTLARQYAEGFMRGVSVGFRPLDYAERSTLADDDPNKAEAGFVIRAAELLEVSAAPIPVQQEALAAKSLGLDPDAELALVREAVLNDPLTRRAVRDIVRSMALAKPEPTRSTPLTGEDALASFLAGE